MKCDRCGSKLRPCPAWFDGELTYVGYYPCPCDEAREEDAGREDWRDFAAQPETRKGVYE